MKFFNKVLLILFPLIILLWGCTDKAKTDTGSADNSSSKPVYKDPTASIEARVADLLSRMTLEEKVAQTYGIWMKKPILDSLGNFSPEKAKKYFEHGFGQIARPSEKFSPEPWTGRTAKQMAEFTNEVQKWFIENTRLGIPILFHEESLHGHAANEGTSYPLPIALASSWDTALVARIQAEIATEVSIRGAQQVLSPVVDVAREPRWGRVEETFGEDPWLVAQMGLAAVRGLQGTGATIPKGKVAATLKHFTGHGQPEAGTNIGPALYDQRTVREVFMYPFKVGVQQGRVRSIMASYNEVGGVPSHGNRELLTTILRNEWGFSGYIVSDYFGIKELMIRHHVAGDTGEAARLALTAGVEVELPDLDFYPKLIDEVKSKRLAEAVLDTAVARILRIKFETGLFDNPYTDPEKVDEVLARPQTKATALEAAQKSIVLLKNNGILPLDKSAKKRIAVIGPNANYCLLGGYSGVPKYAVSPLAGIKALIADSNWVSYAEGCKIVENDFIDWFSDSIKLPDPIKEQKRLADAVALAQKSDVVVLFIGQNEMIQREAWSETHMGDKTTLDLFGNQQLLFDKLKATGKPIIVCLNNGCPLSIVKIDKEADAIVDMWYLGQETGNAIASVLFGDFNPVGRLPITFPRSVGHLPAYYNHKPTARRGYIFDDISPLYPFGFGLSYTSFEFGNPIVTDSVIRVDGKTTVSVNVKNTGSRKGEETVQLYIRDEVSSVSRPVIELKGFKKVTLEPNESKTVTLDITPDMLKFYNINMEEVVEPGYFTVGIGPNSRTLKKARFKVE